MRQQSSVPREQRLALALNHETAQSGELTLVNGQAITALWDLAQPGRIQMFLDENLWGKPAYEVQLPGSALAAPYNLVNGSELVRVKHGWKAVVVALDTPDMTNTDLAVVAIVHLIPRS